MAHRSTLADLRGGARLAADAVVGVADVTEALHATIARPAGRPHRARGIARHVYRAVRRTTRGIERALDGSLSFLSVTLTHDPPSEGGEPIPHRTPVRDALVAALNGVVGDRLVEEGNPLATPMHLRHAGRPLDLDAGALARTVPDPSETVIVYVHGFCMHDGQWGSEAHDPGAVLASGLEATLVSLRYNTGLHIWQNGRAFAHALDRLVASWPRPIRRLVLVGHSMGGLVMRSALHVAAEDGLAWPSLDVSLVTLGSPHHGAPLERLGNHLEGLLDLSRYSAPFGRIGRVRSAGVTDLRYGHLREADGAGRGRFERGPDARRPLPLPAGVDCYLVAATAGTTRHPLKDQTLGDGLVPLDSALGRHPDPSRTLDVPEEHRWVFEGMNHFDLLRHPEVTERLLAWLLPALGRSRLGPGGGLEPSAADA